MYTTDAIVLRIISVGEADELVSFYTSDFGKMLVKVRGSKKITTKQGNFLHDMALIRISFIMGRAGAILSGIKSIKAYRALSSDLYGQGYTMSYLTLCDKLIYEGMSDPTLWRFLVSVLDEAEELTRSSKQKLLWQREKMWLVELMSILGLKPKAIHLDRIKNHRQLDYYLQGVLENKFEQSITFFGLYAR